MQQDRTSGLGEEFVTLSSGIGGISPLEAKLILYRELDDGYGRYFHSIFTQEDRESPTLVRELGSPFTPRLDDASRKCAELAREYIASKKLSTGEWRKSWETVALSGETSKVLKGYSFGTLGNAFIQHVGRELSFVDVMVAKRVLLDSIACAGAEEAVFTPVELASFLYLSLMMDEDWRPQSVCSEELYALIREKASEFVGMKFRRNTEAAPFVGVTFGWPAKDQQEWHLYGDLVTTDVFHCRKSDLPHLFGMACYDAPAEMREKLYNSTSLCVVAVDAVRRSLPDKLGNAYAYNYPVSSIVACKWVGSLTKVLGLSLIHI